MVYAQKAPLGGEATSHSEKIKPAVLDVIKLRLSESIIQSQSVSQSVGQLVGQLVGQSFGRSVSQPVDRKFSYALQTVFSA